MNIAKIISCAALSALAFVSAFAVEESEPPITVWREKVRKEAQVVVDKNIEAGRIPTQEKIVVDVQKVIDKNIETNNLATPNCIEEISSVIARSSMDENLIRQFVSPQYISLTNTNIYCETNVSDNWVCTITNMSWTESRKISSELAHIAAKCYIMWDMENGEYKTIDTGVWDGVRVGYNCSVSIVGADAWTQLPLIVEDPTNMIQTTKTMIEILGNQKWNPLPDISNTTFNINYELINEWTMGTNKKWLPSANNGVALDIKFSKPVKTLMYYGTSITNYTTVFYGTIGSNGKLLPSAKMEELCLDVEQTVIDIENMNDIQKSRVKTALGL